MKKFRPLAVFLAVTLVALVGSAQEREKSEEDGGDRLPEPLESVASNIKDIEKSGYFAIVKAEYARTEVENEEALIWTLTTIKPITNRHAEILIRRFRDVRFYHVPEGRAQEVLTRLMYYSQRIADGAVNNDLLTLDDQFKLWIPLNRAEIRLLGNRKTNKAVFRDFRR